MTGRAALSHRNEVLLVESVLEVRLERLSDNLLRAINKKAIHDDRLAGHGRDLARLPKV